MKSKNQRFVTPKEYAEIVGVAYSTARLHMDQGIVPTVKLGGRTLVPVSFIEELETRARHSAQATTETVARPRKVAVRRARKVVR